MCALSFFLRVRRIFLCAGPISLVMRLVFLETKRRFVAVAYFFPVSPLAPVEGMHCFTSVTEVFLVGS